jgi:hypothetical protein
MSLQLVHQALAEILPPAVAALPCAAHDDVPDATLADQPDTAFPYVVFGRITVTPYMPDDKDTGHMTQYQAELEVWSRYRGRKEAHQVIDLLVQLLHRLHYASDDGELIFILDGSQPVELQSDGRTRRGSVTFTARLLQPTD